MVSWRSLQQPMPEWASLSSMRLSISLKTNTKKWCPWGSLPPPRPEWASLYLSFNLSQNTYKTYPEIVFGKMFWGSRYHSFFLYLSFNLLKKTNNLHFQFLPKIDSLHCIASITFFVCQTLHESDNFPFIFCRSRSEEGNNCPLFVFPPSQYLHLLVLLFQILG